MYQDDRFERFFDLERRPNDRTCRTLPNEVISAIEQAAEAVPTLYLVGENIKVAVDLLKGTKGWLVPVDLTCTVVGDLEATDPTFTPLIPSADFACVWIGVVTGNPLGFIPVLLEPEKYIDVWLNRVNDYAWSFPITCYFFPVVDICK